MASKYFAPAVNLLRRLRRRAANREALKASESGAVITRLQHCEARLQTIQLLQVESCLHRLLSRPRYQEAGRLNRYEAQVCSQSGEDGIVTEIFSRIGTTSQSFVEFGVGDGTCNNTVWLLLQGWNGLWLECDAAAVASIQQHFASMIERQQLRIQAAQVTAENIEALLQQWSVPEEFDLLSIDIDGNDYWVWQAIEKFRPRVVVIEYNARFPPPFRWVRKYDADARWDGTSHFGASLKALEMLAAQKGYNLVGCTLSGINAFFVRADLCENEAGTPHFARPSTAEHFYEPQRYFLVQPNGFPFRFDEFETP